MTETATAITLDPETAAQLISDQFPELAYQPVRAREALGTDNHIFRVGDKFCARFPKAAWAAGTARREAGALPHFSGAPLAVPAVYGLGAPGRGYEHHWSVLSWLPGTPVEDSALSDPAEAARHLAEFVTFVRRIPPDLAFRYGADNNWRGAPLGPRGLHFEAALKRLPEVDAARAMRIWSEALKADRPASPVWLHGDLHPGNVLVVGGQISGVIDWGLCGVGDGACDLLTAWAMFDRAPRDVFRKAMGASDAEWVRGAGWALSMAVIYLPHAYENGLRSDMSETMISRLMEEFA